jgi:cell division protein FtsB
MLLVVLVVAVFISHASWKMYMTSKEALAKKEKAEAELRLLEMRVRDLEGDIMRLSTERGVEEEIRDRFMVAKEGESVIIISTPEQKVHSVIVPDPEPSLLQKLKAAVGFSQ